MTETIVYTGRWINRSEYNLLLLQHRVETRETLGSPLRYSTPMTTLAF